METLKAKLARAEYELKRWKAIFRELPANIAIASGPNHVLEYVNEAYKRSSRVTDVEGKTLAEAHPELVSQGIIELADKIFQEGIPFQSNEFPADLVFPDGTRETHYFNGSIVPMKDEQGNVEALINFNYDVTELVKSRKQLETTQEQLGVAVAAGRLVLWEWHPTNGLTWRSDNLASMFGMSELPKDWNFEVFLNCVHPDDRERLAQHYAEHLQSNESIYKIEYRLLWSDGSVHWVAAHGQTVRDDLGNVIRMVGALLDVTDQKEAELLQIQHKQAAEAANVAKTQFLANMSHEIRTPLAAIMGFSGLLTNPNLPPEKRADFAEAIERNGKALVKLIDDILDISKVESGHLQVSKVPFDLVRFLKEIEVVCQFKADAKGLKLRFTQKLPSPVVRTDPNRLRQILLNVIGNALKFTERGSVNVDVSVEQIDGSTMLVISVQDTGVGIAPSFHSKLFQPFSQAGGSTASHLNGTGLGLAISRKLANALSGDIKLVQSEINQGSHFRIEIGISEVADEALKAEDTNSNSKIPARLQEYNILLAEDTPDIQNLISTYLKQEGARVTVHGNGLDALNAANESFHVALIDLRMPGMDGYSLAKTLKESGSKLPLIAVTAHALTSERELCLEAGFSEYIPKPIDFERLTQTILRLT